jgi:hypothetical protein
MSAKESEMAMTRSMWKLLAGHQDAYSREAFEEIMGAALNVVTSGFVLVEEKSEEERRALNAKVEIFTDKLMHTLTDEAPIVASLGLISAVSAYEQKVREEAKLLRELLERVKERDSFGIPQPLPLRRPASSQS